MYVRPGWPSVTSWHLCPLKGLCAGETGKRIVAVILSYVFSHISRLNAETWNERLHFKAVGLLWSRLQWLCTPLLILIVFRQEAQQWQRDRATHASVDVVRSGWLNLSANFRRKGRRPPTTVAVRKLECVRKLEWLPFCVVSKHPQYVVWFCRKARVWQTDGQNYDFRDRASIAASWGKNDKIASATVTFLLSVRYFTSSLCISGPIFHYRILMCFRVCFCVLCACSQDVEHFQLRKNLTNKITFQWKADHPPKYALGYAHICRFLYACDLDLDPMT